MRHRAPTLILTALSALVLAAPAQGAGDNRFRVYKVTAEGSGTSEHIQEFPGPNGMKSEIIGKTSFAWKTTLPAVMFLPNGEAALTAPAGSEAVTGSVTGTATEETILRGLDGQGNPVTTRGYCEVKNAVRPPLGGLVRPDPITADPDAAGAKLTVTPFGNVVFPANCTGELYGGFRELGIHAGAGALDQRFDLPREATRQGKIIQLVQASPTQRSNCGAPGNGTCSLDWRGTVTFEFTGYFGGSGDEIDPSDLPDVPVPPAGPAAPAPPPEPQDDEDLFIPILTGGKLSKRGDSASVTVACAKACTGTVNAFAARGARPAAAKPLARARFKARAGRPAKVTLRFRGAARRKVRKAGAVRLLIRTSDGARRMIRVRAARR